jgi:hypothetical protein
MQVQKRDAAHEKRILAGMIVDSAVLARIAPKWTREGLFRSKYANLIAGWAVKHHLKFDGAPGRQIESHFERWAERNSDEATFDLIQSFLGHISDAYESSERPTSEYLIDLAATYFNRVRKERFVAALTSDLEIGDDAAADTRFNEYSRLEFGVGAGVDVFQDQVAVKNAFEAATEILIEYKQGLIPFFGSAMSRDSLVCYVSAPSRGKSWWLMDGSYRAMTQGRRVAFFSIGDMSQAQIMKRYMIRASRRPLKPGAFEFPEDLVCERGKRRAQITTKTKSYSKPLDWETAWAACQQIVGKLESKKPMLKLSCHPNGTASVHDIAGILNSWDRAGWTPDVVCIDYADLLRPISKGDPWTQTDETWKALRGMSQARHICLMTATQANMEGIRTDLLRMHHIGNSRTIPAHATSIFGINMTDKEKAQGMCRLNVLKNREEDFDTSMPVHVASCLAIANPAIRAVFER